MQINELPASSALNATDVFAKDTSGTTTEKISGTSLVEGLKLLGNIGYRLYINVTELGLTSGSATILSAYEAMPNSSILIADANNFVSTEVPNSTGTVEIVRCGVARSYIHFYGKTVNNHDYRMYMNSSPNTPTGTWIQEVTGTAAINQGGTAATTAASAISNLFSVGNNDAATYPTSPGIYRTTGRNIFTHMTPSSNYGVLVIFKAVYALHIYGDMYGNLYFGASGDTFAEPSTWYAADRILMPQS